MFKKTVVPLVALILALAWTFTGRAEAQLRPSSLVLLPYFEVDLGNSGKTTSFAVGNALNQQVSIQIEVRSNWGIPVLSFASKLAPHEVKTFNLRDWIVQGKLPGKSLKPAEKAQLKAALSGQKAPDNLFYSTAVAPNLAVGSVVISVVGGAFPALWGDFLLIEPGFNVSMGDDLINLERASCGSWLCRRHALRFLAGASLNADTQVVIWTDRSGSPSKNAYPESQKVDVDGIAYDEAGQPTDDVSLRLLPLQVVSVAALGLSEPFGWLDLHSEDPTFIGLHFDTSSRDGAALQAYCLKEDPPPGPGIELVKRTNGEDANQAPGPAVKVGDPVRWEYIVRNTGSVRLTDVRVTDDDASLDVICPKDTLEAGEEMVCTAEAPAIACQYRNIGSAVATRPDGSQLETSDPSHYFGGQNAALDIELALNGQDADQAPGIEVRAGDPLQWTYVVTNTGDVLLTDIKVTDDSGMVPSCGKTSLHPGESMTCTASGTAASGQHRNLGAVAAKGPCGDDAQDSDPANYNAGPPPLPPAITIKKYTNGYDADTATGPFIKVGDPVLWTYVVTNTGPVTLSDVKVTDDRGVAVSCPKTSLQKGEAMTCTGNGTATKGQYANIGTVTGKAPNGDTATSFDPSHYFGQEMELPCGIKIKKYTNGHDADAAPGPTIPVGGAVQWTYIVSNPGQVILNNVTVTDNRGVAVTCPKTTLKPGEQMTCTGNGTAVAGQYANIGTAVGTPPSGPNATDSDPSHYFGELPKKAEISIKKYTNGQDADTAPGPKIPVGGAVQWTYIVTNIGDVALSNVKVTDDRGVAVSCPKTSLQVGESMTCTGNGTATAGQYKNIGTVVGTPPSGPNVSDSDPSHYYGEKPTGSQGCTPGYWKNHTDSWPPTGYSPSQKVQSVFSQASNYPSLGNASLLDALSFDGGSTIEGAVGILLRASVAALLDSAHPGVNYPRSTASVISDVNAALASGDRDTMLSLASKLDRDNNLGCPLN